MTLRPINILGIIVGVIAINITMILLLPLILIITAVCLILRISINIYLRIKHGKSYGGLLSGADCMWHRKSRNFAIINILAIISTKSTNVDDLLRNVKMSIQNKIFEQSTEYPKFTSSWEDCLGYGYSLKNQCKLDECVYKYPYDEDISGCDFVDKKYLTKFISELAEKPLHQKSFWEFIFVPKPIKWNNNLEQGSTQFATIMRFSHCFGDGFTIAKAIIDALAKDKQIYVKEFEEIFNRILPKRNKKLSFWKKMSKLLKKTCMFIYACCFLLRLVSTAYMDQHLVFAVEEEGGMMDMIKNIKKNQPKASFPNVILTGISASLHQYFQKVSAVAPESIRMTLPVKLNRPKMELKKHQRDNDYSFITPDIPINTANTSIMKRLAQVKNCLNYPTQAAELIGNAFMVHCIFGLIPWYLVTPMLNSKISPGVLSIVPTIEKLLSGNEFTIQDIIFFVPQVGKAGIHFSCVTYNRRFHVGLNVDQALIPNVSDAQSIVDSFMENIRQLHQEVATKTFSV